MAIFGKNTRIKAMSDAAPIAFNAEKTTSDITRTEFSIVNRTKRYWDRNTPVTVETSADGTTWEQYTGRYWIRHAGGTIIFAEPLVAGLQVQVSGAYVTASLVAECNSCNINITNTLSDTTVYEVPGKRQTSMLVDATGTLSGFHDINDLLTDKILEGKSTIIETDFDNTDATGELFCCYAFINSTEFSSAVADPVSKTVGWQSDGKLLVEQK